MHRENLGLHSLKKLTSHIRKHHYVNSKKSFVVGKMMIPLNRLVFMTNSLLRIPQRPNSMKGSPSSQIKNYSTESKKTISHAIYH